MTHPELKPVGTLLTTEQAAAYLGLSPSTLQSWRNTRRGYIPYIKMSGRAVRYRQEDLDRFIDSRMVDE